MYKEEELTNHQYQTEIAITGTAYPYSASESQLTQRKKTDTFQDSKTNVEQQKSTNETSWRRILLLIIAITVHNIPGDTNFVLYATHVVDGHINKICIFCFN